MNFNICSMKQKRNRTCSSITVPDICILTSLITKRFQVQHLILSYHQRRNNPKITSGTKIWLREKKKKTECHLLWFRHELRRPEMAYAQTEVGKTEVICWIVGMTENLLRNDGLVSGEVELTKLARYVFL